MIVVRLKVNKQLTGQYWKDYARGTIDIYGNPFRILKLNWGGGKLHPNTDYAKTRGFEDAIIGKNRRTGGFKITYRRNGSIMWQRPPGNVGPFFGELADTPYNREKLAAMYGDKLWTIQDQDIEVVVRAMYKKRLEAMDKTTLDFNRLRINGMHTHRLKDDVQLEGAPIEAERKNLDEVQKNIRLQQVEIDKKSIELKNREEKLVNSGADLVEKNISTISYGKEYLDKCNFVALKAVAKELGIKFPNTAKKAQIYQAIIDKQLGKPISFRPIEEESFDDVVVPDEVFTAQAPAAVEVIEDDEASERLDL